MKGAPSTKSYHLCVVNREAGRRGGGEAGRRGGGEAGRRGGGVGPVEHQEKSMSMTRAKLLLAKFNWSFCPAKGRVLIRNEIMGKNDASLM